MKTPGVSIQEIATLPASIAAVETAVPAFIGYTTAQNGVSSLEPKRITSLKEYVSLFGGADVNGLKISVKDIINGSELTDRNVTVDYRDYSLYQSMKLFFANGGGQCYVVSVGLSYNSATSTETVKTQSAFEDGIDAIKSIDEPTLILFPQASELLFNQHADVVKHALQQCAKLQDRFVISDVSSSHQDIDDATNNPEAFAGALPSENLMYGSVYYPAVKSYIGYSFSDDLITGVEHKKSTDGGVSFSVSDHDGKNMETIQSDDTSFYSTIKQALNTASTSIPVSGAVAGVFAATDDSRGVWKAPANVSLSNVIEPVIKLSDKDQESLNSPSTGRAINAIRTFAGKGSVVWGARTLDANSAEWRYVNVRRLYNYVEESVKKAMENFVFEPNTAQTWLRLKSTIENFLTDLWRQGGLSGAKASDAYFVNIGLGSTMTSTDILEGKLNIEIGMAASRPAEFIILKFSQKQQVS